MSDLRLPAGRLRVGGGSFRRRIVATTALAVAGLVAVVGLLLHLVVDRTAARDVDELLRTRAAAAVELIRAASPGTTIRVPPTALEPGTLVVDARGRAVAGGLPRAAERAAAEVVASGETTTTGGGDDVRLRAVPFRTGGGTAGTVVVTADTDLYEQAEVYVTTAILVLGALATAIAAVVAGRVARQALSPVSVMAQRAAEWSSHDLAHRFDLGPPTDELTTLGATLDGLLDRVAMAIRSEQRLTAELAHELRTPLAGIRGSADLALLRARDRGIDDDVRADLEAISASARAMGEVITTLLDLARRPDAAEASCRLSDVVPRLRVDPPDGVDLTLRLDLPQRIAGPADVVAAALTPLVENALRHARSRVEVTATPRSRAVVVQVVDDGAGLDPEVGARIFEPGTSGGDGTGLGLAIARRAARSVGGEITVGEPTEPGTTAFDLRLPTLA